MVFDPQSFSHSNVDSIQTLVQKTMSECDKDILRDLFQNIVICGGTSNLQNFGTRLHG